MTLTTRLLGLAFASADTLVEVAPNGVVAFAIGAGAAAGEDAGATWTGRPLADLLHDGSAILATLQGMKAGVRIAPTCILVSAGPDRVRRATFRAFVLPQMAPAVSCAISYDGPAFAVADLETRPLMDPDAFLADAGRVLEANPDLALSFLDIQGMENVGDDVVDRLNRRIEATLQSAAIQGSGAAQLTAVRFALLRPANDRRDIAAEIVEAGRAEGLSLGAEAFNSPVPPGSDSLCVLRAMRFAIEGCLKGDGLANPQIAFADSLKRTFRDAETFRSVVKSREFQVHYQPIVHLDSRAVHHFEALARFKGNNGPADAIRMAEELDLIESFDLAVAEKVLRRMRQPGAGLLKMAINVSGASLGDDTYVEQLLRMTAGAPEERRRLIVEVTETSAVADIEAADRRLASLREAGIKVCIDDFGAGSAAFDYLRKLSVDAVKIDGAIVRDIETDDRSKAMLHSIVELCRSMKLETIAEMIETDRVANELKTAGVEYGQGWLFGRAEAEPRTQLNTPSMVRRKGAVEAWG
ncbi:MULTISPECIES: EAL domain-containing protein [unclassified Brevundimonas]|uniref:EAL domain-containing protein n=1 Tax=unclassified Brevundimonas TaxID=2622653 RepID=UPI000E8BE10E|nr:MULTISPECIES: EAL domain-containing protein [unclassified Brevundimonas]MCK6104619.1 EAL domain-containing protein [Brevundimonas sp. EYE_349]HBI20119.1 EAL domain-containing protein [Brevundimonas sp.]